MARYYDRYESFLKNGKSKLLPFLRIPSKNTDQRVKYDSTKRLDIISDDYYGSPYYGWLILLANPQYGGLEFDIPDGAIITIPFPLELSLQQYQEAVTNHRNLFGI
jgi:hypothetical protein